MRQGVVTQVSPLLVRIGDSLVGTPCTPNAGYSAALNDRVTVFVQGGDRVVAWRNA